MSFSHGENQAAPVIYKTKLGGLGEACLILNNKYIFSPQYFTGESAYKAKSGGLTIKTWDITRRRELETLSVPTESIVCVYPTLDNNYFVIGFPSKDRKTEIMQLFNLDNLQYSIKQFELKKQRNYYLEKGINNILFFANKKHYLSFEVSYAGTFDTFTGDLEPNEIRLGLWDIEEKEKPIREFNFPSNKNARETEIFLLADKKHFIAGAHYNRRGKNYTHYIWNCDDPNKAAYKFVSPCVLRSIRSLSDGRHFIGHDYGVTGNIFLFDIKNLKAGALRIFSPGGFHSKVQEISILFDGYFVVSYAKEVCIVWHFDSGTEIFIHADNKLKFPFITEFNGVCSFINSDADLEVSDFKYIEEHVKERSKKYLGSLQAALPTLPKSLIDIINTYYFDFHDLTKFDLQPPDITPAKSKPIKSKRPKAEQKYTPISDILSQKPKTYSLEPPASPKKTLMQDLFPPQSNFLSLDDAVKSLDLKI